MNVAGTLTYEDVTNSETAGVTTTGGLVVTGLGATFGEVLVLQIPFITLMTAILQH